MVEARRRGERVRRGYIGVGLQDIDEGVAAALGIERNRGELIRTVTAGGPAERAGIEQGDVVVSVAGQPVTPDQTLAYLVAQQPVGSRVPLEVLRNGQRRTVTVTVAERPSEEELARLNNLAPDTPETEGGDKDEPQSSGQRSTQSGLGVSVQTLTPDLARRMQLGNDVRGVVVVAVEPNSDAGQKGIQPGDVILSIDRSATATPEAAAAAIEAARRARRSTVLLQVRRGANPPAYVGVEIANP